MFRNLTNFSYQRSTKQAIGFYLAYLLLLLLLCPATGIIAEKLFNIDNNTATLLGTFVAIITALTLSVLISLQKNIIRDYKPIILIILAGVLSSTTGGFGGLIPAAYLSTLAKKAV